MPGPPAEHVAGQRQDGGTALGHIDEGLGVEAAALGVVPAHQGLDRHDLQRLDVHDRLIVEVELVPRRRP